MGVATNGIDQEEVSSCRLEEGSDLGDGLRDGHTSAWEGADCPDVGHMVPSGGLLIPLRMDILQPIHTDLARGYLHLDPQ